MCYKLDRSLLGVLVAIMLVAPPVQALNDEVAVQLLERLNDLEGEVSALRSENENLKDKLDGTLTREDDENQVKAEAVQAGAEAGLNVEEHTKALEPTPITEPQIPGVNIIVEDAADIPSLEQETAITSEAIVTDEATAASVAANPPAQADFLTTSPVDAAPALLNAAAATAESTTAAPTATVIPEVAAPELAPVPAPTANAPVTTPDTTTQTPSTAATPEVASAVSSVDPKSKDSYYYYGTSEEQQPTELKPAEVKPAAAGVPSAANPVADSSDQGRKAKADYNQAYQLLVNKPAEAVPLFRSFLANYPQHELAANAQYWLAEALYAQKDFEGASQEFMKVLKQYKDSPKSSGAALKLGYSFYELQQWEYARRTLEDTVRFFPDTSSAKLAEARLQKMKNEGH